jgi:hypothetical protein
MLIGIRKTGNRRRPVGTPASGDPGLFLPRKVFGNVGMNGGYLSDASRYRRRDRSTAQATPHAAPCRRG